MRRHIGFALAFSSLWFAFVATPANATVTSRASTFLFTCDGSNKTVTFNFGGFAVGSTQLVLGGELAIFENRGALQYVIMRVQGDATKQLVTVTLSDNRAQTMFPGAGIAPLGNGSASATIPATIPASGNLVVTVDGACGGTGQTQGVATIWLLSNP
jgi:hypothetical protein